MHGAPIAGMSGIAWAAGVEAPPAGVQSKGSGIL
jgi:hypothetical protein